MFITPWQNGNENTWDTILETLSEIRKEKTFSELRVSVLQLSDTRTSVEDSDETSFYDSSTKLVKIYSALDLADKIGDPFETTTDDAFSTNVRIFNVDRDPVGNQDVIVSVSRTVGDQNVVVGVDLSYENIFQDFVFFPRDDSIRISLVEKSTGQVVFHPSLCDRVNAKVSPQIGQIHFGQLESDIAFRKIVENPSGRLTSDNVTYTWHRVSDSDYVVVIMSTLNDKTSLNEIVDDDESLPKTTSNQKPPRIFFHRLDVLSTKMQSKLCRHFVAPATLESGSLYLSSDAFFEPWDRPKNIRSQVKFLKFYNLTCCFVYLNEISNLVLFT